MTTEQSPPPPAPQSPAVQTAAKAIDEFRRSLSQITPRAWVTPLLVALNVAVFVAFSVTDHSIMNPSTSGVLAWGANYGPKTTSGQWWRLFTHMFMHFGVIHILMNMAILWDIGRIVEKMTGNLGFLVAYLLAGLGGGIASLVWNPSVLSAGASGAVFGVFGLLLGFLARSRGSVPPEVLKHLQKSAVVFIGYNVLFGLAKSGIDNAAHVGGLITGSLCGLALAYPLTPEGARSRTKKSLLVLVGGLLLVGGATFAIPHGRDYLGDLDRFGAVEEKVINAYNAVVSQDRTFDDAATRLEHDVLTPWREENERWQGGKGLRGDQQALADNIKKYLSARQQGFETMIDAAKKHDQEAFQRGRDQVHKAGEIMKNANK